MGIRKSKGQRGHDLLRIENISLVKREKKESQVEAVKFSTLHCSEIAECPVSLLPLTCS